MERDGAVAVQRPSVLPTLAKQRLETLILQLVRANSAASTSRILTLGARSTSPRAAAATDKLASEPHSLLSSRDPRLHAVCPPKMITDLLVPVYSRHNSRMALNRICPAALITVNGRLGEERNAQFGVRGKRRAFRHPGSSSRERISQRNEFRLTHIGMPEMGRHKGVQCVGL